MLADLVETRQLVETVIASLVAGIGVTAIFAIAIWGGARFAELNRNDRPLAAGGAAAVAVLALLGTLGAVVLGIITMTSK